MKEKIKIGDFIDKLKALSMLEIVVFLHAWEETAPIFHGKNYRLTPLTENFVIHLLNEIDCFTYFLLKGLRGKPRLMKLAIERMNGAIETVNTIADNYIEAGQTPQITERG